MGSPQALGALLADLFAAAGVLVVGGDISDAGVEADGVVVAAGASQLGSRAAGSRIASSWGFSALTCPKRLSIQAWSVGVRGRPRRWATASAAKNSRVAFDVIWGPLSEQASRIGSVGSCSKSSTLSGVMSSVRPSAARARSKRPDLGGGLLDRYQRVDASVRLTTSTANATRRARGKWVASQHQILLGAHTSQSGHSTRGAGSRAAPRAESVSCQDTAQRRRRHPHPALIGAPVSELSSVHRPPLFADVEDLLESLRV